MSPHKTLRDSSHSPTSKAKAAEKVFNGKPPPLPHEVEDSAAMPTAVLKARGGSLFKLRPFEKQDMDGLYFLLHRCCNHRVMPSFRRLLDMLLWTDSAALVSQVHGADSFGLAAAVMVRLQKEQQAIELIWCGVHAPFRRRGLARGMVHFVRDLAVREELRQMTTSIEKDNEAAKVFLSTLGFSETGTQAAVLYGKTEGNSWHLPLDAQHAVNQPVTKIG